MISEKIISKSYKIVRVNLFSMIVFLMFSLNVSKVNAEEVTYLTWSGGKTSVLETDNTYIIDTPEELAWFASAVNSGNTFSGKKICITGNMDLNYKTWTPIGNGHTIAGDIEIKNCYIKGLTTNTELNGLFGGIYVNNLIVNNLNIQGTSISLTNWAQHNAGMLAGGLALLDNAYVEISNSYFGGTIDIRHNFNDGSAGGVVGVISYFGTNAVMNLYNNTIEANVYGSEAVGGVIGHVSYVNGKLDLTQVFSKSTVVATNSYGYEETKAGGLIGVTSGGKIYICQSAVEGSVKSGGYAGYCGGVIGWAVFDLLQLKDSYVTASLTSNFNGWSGTKYNAGGFFGYSYTNYNSNNVIQNCYFAGTTNSGCAFVAHDGNSGSAIAVKNCYFDTSVSGIPSNVMYTSGNSSSLMTSSLSGCAGYSTSDMKKESSYVNWNFDNMWYMDKDKYPMLCRKSITKDNCQYSIKIVDALTNKPINAALVKLNDEEIYETVEDGSIKIGIESFNDYKGKEIIISSAGYDDYKCYITDWSLYTQNVIELKNENYLLEVQNLMLGSQTIKGPTVNLFGEECTLFTLDVGIDFSKIFGFKEEGKTIEELQKVNNVLVDEASKTVKIMLGFAEDWEVKSGDKTESFDAVIDFFKAHRRLNKDSNAVNIKRKYDSIKKKLEENWGALGKTDIKLGCEASLTGYGYVELDYSSGEAVLKEGGYVFVAETGVSQDIPWGSFAYATFALKGEFEGKIILEKVDSGFGIEPYIDTAFAVKPSLGIGAKLITKEIASIEAGLKGKIEFGLKMPASTLEEALRVLLSGQGYVKGNILFFAGEVPLNFPEVELFPNLGVKTASINTFSMRQNTFNVISRDYIDSGIQLLSLTETLNAMNVYPYSVPRLAKLDDGTIVALWIKDDGTKSDNNRTTLYYSVYESDAWSTPLAVYESGRADFSPEVAVDGNAVSVVWQRATQVFGDEYDITSALESTELVYSKFENGAFSEPIVITEDNARFEVDYSVAAENGVTIVSWIENDENDYMLNSGNNSIYSRVLENGEWGVINTVRSDSSTINSIASGFVDGVPQVAYSIISSDLGEDFELYLGANLITDDLADDVSVSYQNNAFYWIKDTSLCYYEGGATVDTGLVCSDKKYVVISEGDVTAILFSKADDFTNELYISYERDGQYTNPVALTDYERHISQYDVEFADGNLMIFAAVDNIDEEADYPYTTTDLFCEVKEGWTDLAIGEYVFYDDKDIQIGDTVTFTTEIINCGTNSVEGFELSILDAEENALTTVTVTEAMASGETRKVSIGYVIPEAFVKQELKLELSLGKDRDSSNNSTIITFGKADIKVTECYIEDGIFKGKVENTGLIPAEQISVDVNYFRDTKVLLTTISMSDLEPGASEAFSYELPETYLSYENQYSAYRFIVEATSTSEESNYANNEISVLDEPIRVNSISLDINDKTLYLGEWLELNATVQPANAVNQNVIWISDSTDIATVDENGIVETCGVGTAIITAIAEDGNCVERCIVTVIEKEEPTIEERLNGISFRHNCSFDNNFTLVYAIKQSDLEGFDNIRLFVEKDEYEGDTLTETSTKELKWTSYTIGSDDYYRFDYSNIKSCEIGDEVRAVLVAEKDGVEYRRTADVYNLKDYAYNRLAASDVDEFKILLVDMLNYCAASQEYFDYRENSLVNSELTEEQRALSSRSYATLNNNESTIELEGKTVPKIMKNVSFGNRIEAVFAMDLSNYDDISKITLHVEYTDMNGEEKVLDIGSGRFTYDSGIGMYYGKVSSLDAAELRKVMTVTVMHDGVPVSDTITYSIETYVSKKLASSTDDVFKALLEDMMIYADSAQAYFEQQ